MLPLACCTGWWRTQRAGGYPARNSHSLFWKGSWELRGPMDRWAGKCIDCSKDGSFCDNLVFSPAGYKAGSRKPFNKNKCSLGKAHAATIVVINLYVFLASLTTCQDPVDQSWWAGECRVKRGIVCSVVRQHYAQGESLPWEAQPWLKSMEKTSIYRTPCRAIQHDKLQARHCYHLLALLPWYSNLIVPWC